MVVQDARAVEHLPPESWKTDSLLGPAWDECKIKRSAGSVIVRDLGDLHCVGEVAPGTFTLVETGPEKVVWGFHPPGKMFMPSKLFLAKKG